MHLVRRARILALGALLMVGSLFAQAAPTIADDSPIRTHLITKRPGPVRLLTSIDVSRSVLTQRTNAARTGTYITEQTLSPAILASGRFGFLRTRKVKGLISAPPLYVHGVTIGGKQRNVMYVATRDDRVYAIDADNTSVDPHAGVIWERELWDPHNGPPGIGMHAAPLPGAEDGPAPCWQTRGPIGILGTPVIDAATQTLYVAYRVGLAPDLEPSDLPQNPADWSTNHYRTEAHHFLVALDLRTGANRIAPIEISAPNFDPTYEMNRPGLLLQGGIVYVGFANPVCDHGGNPYTPVGNTKIGGGWLFAYNAATLTKIGAFRTAPNAGGAGIWQSGNGIAGDGTNAFVFTGNNYGSDALFNHVHPYDFGESILKFGVTADGLALDGYYRAANWYKLDTGDPHPPNDEKTFGDSDLGSAGPVLLPGARLIGGGKQGHLYLVDTTHMSLLDERQAFFNTWHQNPGQPACNEDLNIWSATCYIDPVKYDESQGYGPNIHANPVVWSTGNGTTRLYAMPEKDYLRAYTITPSGIAQTAAATTQAQGIRSPDGMPGAALTLSSDGANNGIVWASYVADRDGTACPVFGDLQAFDAQSLRNVWSAADPHIYSKFTSVTVADGKVFRPTFGNEVAIYGVGSSPPSVAQFGPLAPGSPVTAVWSNLNHLDLFSVAKSGNVMSSYLESDRQSDNFSIGPTKTFSPRERVTAVWSNPHHLDLFAAGNDGHVHSTWWESGLSWQPWFSIEPASALVPPTAPVTAVWSNPQHLDLFVSDANGTVRSTWWEGRTGYAAWFPIGPARLVRPGQPVTAIWSNPKHLDLFAVNVNGAVISTYWEAARGWRPWFTIGQSATVIPGQAITALWSNAQHLDLFTTSAGGAIVSTYWEAARGYVPWFSIHPEDLHLKPGTPIAARWAIWPTLKAPQLDLFAIGSSGHVVSTFWTGARSWVHGFTVSQPSLRAVAGAAVEAVYSQPGPVNVGQWPRLELFTSDGNGEIARARFDRSGGCGWQPFVEL